jgi:aryl-alcohol dehydrogenase-like predicted oxidoreductase
MKVALGTVQFGLNYGISNTNGQVPIETVRSILKLAKDNSIGILDTAAAYGNSEEVLGNCNQESQNFNIVTKIPADSKYTDISNIVKDSLSKLKRDKLYALLMHNTDSLLSNDGELYYQELLKLKDQNIVDKIGVSIYSQSEVDLILERYEIDIIQVPLNIIDQRLIKSNTLKRLREKGVEVHARSLFLQGLFFLDTTALDPFFSPVKETLLKLKEEAKRLNCSLLDILISFGNDIEEIDQLVIGVTSEKELEEVIASANSNIKLNWADYSISSEEILNPSNWPKK